MNNIYEEKLSSINNGKLIKYISNNISPRDFQIDIISVSAKMKYNHVHYKIQIKNNKVVDTIFYINNINSERKINEAKKLINELFNEIIDYYQNY